MTNIVDVVDVNPIMFVKLIVEQIQNGFYVQNSIPGYPYVGMPMMIRLFETDAPEIRNTLHEDIHTVVVEGYDIMQWLLDVQDVALQGFNVELKGASVDDYKSVTMVKAVPVSLDGLKAEEATTEPTPAKAKRAAKAKPTQTQEGE